MRGKGSIGQACSGQGRSTQAHQQHRQGETEAGWHARVALGGHDSPLAGAAVRREGQPVAGQLQQPFGGGGTAQILGAAAVHAHALAACGNAGEDVHEDTHRQVSPMPMCTCH